MSAPLNLTDILFAQRSVPRGDEAEAHIADLYGCDRATWYRRNGYAPEPFTQEKLAQFAIGHAYEQNVARTLREAGIKARENVEVTLHGLTGHPDIVTDEALIEVKTTEARKPKDEVSPHHALQASAYALAVGAPKWVVLVKHAGSHIEAEYHGTPDGYAAIIERRAAEIHANTAPGAPIPEADPGEFAPWGCGYCAWLMCAKNPKHVPEEVPA